LAGCFATLGGAKSAFHQVGEALTIENWAATGAPEAHGLRLPATLQTITGQKLKKRTFSKLPFTNSGTASTTMVMTMALIGS
jgi:hypothetical protein